MLLEQPPSWVRPFFPALWRKEKETKKIYLSFDDGPIPIVTPWVLNELDQLDIKATFFCIGENVAKYPEIYKDILKRGHKVGVHGYCHKRGLFRKKELFYKDIAKAGELVHSNLYRPPHGDIKRSEIRRLEKQYTIVLWDVITRDYNQSLKPEKVLRIAKRYGRNGSIVVFHDSEKAAKNMKYAFPRAVKFWKSEGYTFGTL